MQLIDTHCHINFDSYDDDRPALLTRAAEVGVTRIINPAIDLETSRTVPRLADQFDGLFATVGIHPNSTADFADNQIPLLAKLARHEKVVAVGEIGLDYHWDKSPKAVQARAFEAQLELAAQLELPVVIHNREASADVLPILENWVKDLPPSLRERPGVLHSFSAPHEYAERALAARFYLGFTGPITYRNADNLRYTAAHMPLDRILLETDGPFLTPLPHRGKRNEPAYIPLIAERIATLRQISTTDLAAATTANAERLFRLPAM